MSWIISSIKKLGRSVCYIILLHHLYHHFTLLFQEAKNAFKALLESANVHSDWTWEQVDDTPSVFPLILVFQMIIIILN